MNLIIDIGNSLSKVAVADGKEIKFFQNYKELDIGDLMPIINNFRPQRCIVSAVGKIPVNTLVWLRQNLPVHIAGANTNIPLKNDYSTPETLGFDRLALAVGANYLLPNQNVLVIDAGTAITYDLVTSEGVYKGGAISPGLRLRFKALNDYTAKLPLIEHFKTVEIVGASTVECISSGVINGTVLEIDGYVEKINSIYEGCIVVLTGGDANFLANMLKNSIFVNPFLMVIGLNRILEFNV
ncbi:MAG TPA: type III pantothenate kinase [Bacteroidales bacterium]|nr:type III pantothenate kinase [Bacteroidales bacterium]